MSWITRTSVLSVVDFSPQLNPPKAGIMYRVDPHYINPYHAWGSRELALWYFRTSRFRPSHWPLHNVARAPSRQGRPTGCPNVRENTTNLGIITFNPVRSFTFQQIEMRLLGSAGWPALQLHSIYCACMRILRPSKKFATLWLCYAAFILAKVKSAAGLLNEFEI